MQQIPKQLAVVNVRRCGRDRMDQLGLAIDANMPLHAEVPLVTFFCLTHFRVSLAVFVLGRAGRIDDRRIHSFLAVAELIEAAERHVEKTREGLINYC